MPNCPRSWPIGSGPRSTYAAFRRDLGGTAMQDEALFMRAKREADILITKDVDIVHLLRRHGPPPKVIWLRMGNTSNARLKEWFTHRWNDVLAFAESSEPLVEVAE